MSFATLEAGDARIEIAPEVGGAIAAFRWRGVDVLRPTSEADRAAGNVRGFACYPLVPYSNRIAQARLRVDGRDFSLARNFGEHPHSIHGVGWQSAWTVAAHDLASVLLAFEHDALGERAAAWPFPFRATQSISLAAGDGGAVLQATLAIENIGSEAFPFGLGWHPFFPRDDATTLGFCASAAWENDATQLPQRRVALPPAWRFDPPRVLGATTLDQVFEGWDGTARVAWPGRGLAVTLEADRACSRLVVYVPPGRDFLAVEPVTHMTDAFNHHAAGDATTGTRILPPGAGFSCTMRVAVAPAQR